MGDHLHNGRPKRAWPTRAAARAALAQQRAQGIDNTGQNPYRCTVCGQFHLGHYPTDPTARAAKRQRHRSNTITRVERVHRVGDRIAVRIESAAR